MTRVSDAWGEGRSAVPGLQAQAPLCAHDCGNDMLPSSNGGPVPDEGEGLLLHTPAVPCFTPGTLIATPRGEVPVEMLKAGDRIITRDNGVQEIRWAGRKDLTGRDLVSAPHLRPVFIRGGALGNGLPERDMLVSPNHRMLVASERTQLYFDDSEVLASARHLVGLPGIRVVDALRVSYLHFMFDRHEIVLSNGAWTESFQPCQAALRVVGDARRSEICALFPELAVGEGQGAFAAARKTLKGHEVRLVTR